ncbi:MAG: hypothetical protein WCE52_21745, partial [Candidatus Acidiferrum sp.]
MIDTKAAPIATSTPFAYPSILRGFDSVIESDRWPKPIQNVSAGLTAAGFDGGTKALGAVFQDGENTAYWSVTVREHLSLRSLP